MTSFKGSYAINKGVISTLKIFGNTGVKHNESFYMYSG